MQKLKSKLKFNFVFDEKFESSLLTIFLGLFVGIFWISFIIWNRLIRERLPKDLTETVGELDTIGFYIQLGLCIYFFSIFIFSSYKLYKKLRGIEKSLPLTRYIFFYLDKRPKLIDIIQFFINYILNAPWYLWRFFLFNVQRKYLIKFMRLLEPIFATLENKFYNPRTNYIRRRIITWVSLVYLPRIIAFTIFLYEIAVNKYIFYFYYVAIILLIPLIMIVIRRIMFDLGHYYSEFIVTSYIAGKKILTVTSEKEVKVDVWESDFETDLEDLEVAKAYMNDYCLWKAFYNIALRYVVIDNKYGLYGKITGYLLLSLSLSLMLLIRVGMY